MSQVSIKSNGTKHHKHWPKLNSSKLLVISPNTEYICSKKRQFFCSLQMLSEWSYIWVRLYILRDQCCMCFVFKCCIPTKSTITRAVSINKKKWIQNQQTRRKIRNMKENKIEKRRKLHKKPFHLSKSSNITYRHYKHVIFEWIFFLMALDISVNCVVLLLLTCHRC